MMWCNAGICLIITLVPKKYFTLIAKVGVAITICAMLVVVSSGIWLLPGHVATDQSVSGSGLAGVSGALAGVFLSSGDHVCFPAIYSGHCRNDRTIYKAGMTKGFVIFSCACLAYCIPLYMTFGSTIHPNSLTNIGLGIDGASSGFPKWLRTAVNGVLALRILFIIPNFMPGLFALFDYFLLSIFKQDLHGYDEDDINIVGCCGGDAGNGGRDRVSGFRFILLLLSRILTYCLLAFLGVFFQSLLAALINIVGSFFQSVNAVIIPCLAYLRLCNPSTLQKIPLLFVACLGIVWCVAGTTVGILQVVQSLTEA